MGAGWVPARRGRKGGVREGWRRMQTSESQAGSPLPLPTASIVMQHCGIKIVGKDASRNHNQLGRPPPPHKDTHTLLISLGAKGDRSDG